MPEAEHPESLLSEHLLPLVYEAWLRLAGEKELTWINRTHFFRATALAMRPILIDLHRRKKLITPIIYEQKPYEKNLQHCRTKTSDNQFYLWSMGIAGDLVRCR